MDRSGIRDDVAPWSFFLPVSLAVIVGGLAAGLILRAVDMVFAPDPQRAPAADVHRTAPPEPGAAPAAAAPDQPASTPPQDAAMTNPGDTGTAQATTAGTSAPSASGVPVLPGAIVARRDGAPEACINGSIALRAENGWEQRLEHDAPMPCVEASATAR